MQETINPASSAAPHAPTGPRPPRAEHGASPPWPRLAVMLALGATFAHALSVSWLKWGDPVVDGGREMMMPARMLLGETLYVDHRNIYGPLAPYLNMALFKVFGIHLSVLQVAGAVSAVLMTVAFYLLARRFIGRLPAASLTVTFIYTFALAHLAPNPGFNFVVPYAYAATYGMVAAAYSLLFLVRHAQDGRVANLALALAGLVLSALAKLEVLVPTLAAHTAWLAGAAITRRLNLRSLSLYGAALAIVAGAYGFLFVRTGSRLWTDNLAAVVNAGNQGYVSQTMGFDDLGTSILMVGISTGALVVAVGLGLSAAHLMRRVSRVAFKVAVVAAAGSLCFVMYAVLGPVLAMRLLPLLAVVALPALAWRFWRQRARREEILPELILWAFSAACLLRLGLLAGPVHYGFFLCPVPFLALGVALFRTVAGRIRSPWGQRAIVSAGLGIVGGIAVGAYAISALMYAEHTMEVRTPRGHILLRGEPWQPELIAYLQQLPRDMRVAVIPQGAGLLFLAGTRMAGGLYSYAPMEMSGEHTDQEVVQRFSVNPPDLVVSLAQDPGSFRWTGFGVEYGHGTADWLRANYVPVAGNREVSVLRYVGSRRPAMPTVTQ